MKKRIIPVLHAIEILILLLVMLIGCYVFVTKYKATELCRESSPDEKFFVLVQEIGEPGFPFGSDRIEVTLFEKRSEEYPFKPFYMVSFTADIPTDGTKAGYRVEWLDDGVQVVLRGEKGREYYYILPFKTIE